VGLTLRVSDGLRMMSVRGAPNSHLGRGQQSVTSRGTSPSVGARVVDDEVDDVDLADAADED
jgi:hypothetical protein